MKLILFLGLTAFAFMWPICDQQATAQTQQDELTLPVPKWTTGKVIDFRLTQHNNMVVKAVLNEVDDCELMFHTAVDSMSLISTSTPSLKSVHFTHEGNTISWGG